MEFVRKAKEYIDKNIFKDRKVNTILYYFFVILFLEVIYKVNISSESFFNMGLLYMPVFSMAISFLLTFITKLFNEKANRILLWVITVTLCLLFAFQYIFVSLLSVPFSFHSLSLANQAADFGDIIIKTIWKHIIGFVLLFLPIIFLAVFRKRMNYTVVDKKHKLRYILAFMFVHIFAFLILLPNKGAVYSPYKLYHNMDVSNNTNSHFGLLTGMRLDLKRFILKSDNYVIEVVNMNPENKLAEYGYNVTDIDFEALKKQTKDKNLEQMHNYFENETPTQKNEYTGLFKDKNLIFIVAEGFSDIAVDEKLTPTLYKLSNESFVFKNFYTPVMFSTIGGEIQSLLGLIPFQETINIWPLEKPTFPYSIGNSFKKQGYTAKAYHNWTYTYYDRDKTRPTIRI